MTQAVIGMTLTFGAVLPTAFGALAALVGAALYLYVYPLDYTLDQILDAHCLKTNAIVITLRNRNSFPHVVDVGGRDLFPYNTRNHFTSSYVFTYTTNFLPSIISISADTVTLPSLASTVKVALLVLPSTNTVA